MANILTLPDLGTTGESIQDILSEQRDVSIRIESVVERSYSKLNIIEDVLKSQLAIQEQQADFLRTQSENAEFAAEEARREAERSRLAASRATATPAADQPGGGGFGLGGIAAGLAGGLAAGGAGAALRILAGRLLRGGGLAALGYYFGDQLGKFLATEADALLDDVGVSEEWQQTITNALRNNTDEALIFGGISKILFGRTLPGIIAGFVLGGLDIEKLFSPDEEVRQQFYNDIGTKIEEGWDAIVENKQLAGIITGSAIVGLMLRGPLPLRIAGAVITAFGLSNILPGDEDVDSLNTKIINETSNILEGLGFGEQGAETGADILAAGTSAFATGLLSRLIFGKFNIPAVLATFMWEYFDLARIFTPEGRDELLGQTEEAVRRLLAGQGMTEDYINAAIATLGIGYAARKGAQILSPRPTPTFTPEGIVEGPGQLARPGSGTAPQTGQFVRPRRPNGQFMSDAEIQDMYEQQISNAKYKRVYRNVLKGLAFLGVALTAVEAYELYQILNSDASEDAKRAAVGTFIGGFVGALSGGAGGAALGSFFGPWGALIGGALGAGAGGFAGGYVGEWIAGWAFEDTPPEYEIGGISSQADVDAYLREYGIEPPVRAPQQVGGRGSVVEAPGARALAGQIAGTQAELEAAQVARDDASNRAARRDANQNVRRLETALEELQEELEELNNRFQSAQTAQPQNISYVNPQTSQGRVIMAAARGGSTPRTMQAALNPSFNQPGLIRASLSTRGTDGDGSDADIDNILATIRSKESGGDYSAYNFAWDEYVRSGGKRGSSATGAYQFIKGTWSELTNRYGIGQQYEFAREAPANIQDEVARRYVEQILRENGGDVSVIPNVWYTGNAAGVLSEDALATNNGMTAAEYQSDWLSRYAQIAGGSAPARVPVAPSDQTAADSMIAGIGSGGGAGASSFFDMFGGETLSALIRSDNPEQVGALMIQDFFSQIGVGRPGVTPAAVEMNNGSENATTAPIIVNAPQINNDNSVQASGGGGRERASQQLAIAPIGERSVASTISDWWDATMA